MLVVVACGREVGVDVEPLGRGPWLSLPSHVLTAPELRSLDGLAGQARNAAFLRLWTRKEAVLKAAGVGLAVEPRLVAVSGPAEPPEVLSVPASIGTAARFGLVDLPLPGFAGSVAVERPHGPVVLLREVAPRAHEILTAARSAAYDSAVASRS
jgi:4'-phosphopantetheinyl transferase